MGREYKEEALSYFFLALPRRPEPALGLADGVGSLIILLRLFISLEAVLDALFGCM